MQKNHVGMQIFQADQRPVDRKIAYDFESGLSGQQRREVEPDVFGIRSD